MKRWKISVFCLLLMFVFAGCGSGEAGNDGPKPVYSGVWEDDAGDIIRFLPEEESYVLQKANGRIGTARYLPSEAYFDFNRFIYDIIPQDDGSIFLYRNGSPADDSEESMDGYFFRPSDKDDITVYELEDLLGTWVADNGTELSLDMETMEYNMVYENGVRSGTIGNEDDGRGYFLFVDDYAFFILDEDGSLRFETIDHELNGRVFRR